MSQLRTTVFQYFQTDDIPTESQFQYSWSSVWFKDEKFSISDTSGLETALQNKLGTAHTSDENAHVNSLAKLNASNLNDDQKEAWKNALGVGEIPENVALVDLGESTQVYNKAQIHEISMMLADFVNDGKISADKIEALGLTDLIEASENTLAAFVDNTDAYEFQKNDFIAIPDVNGNHSLFMFKGGDKAILGNYLATGLSNITIPMVEGLQMALNGKLDKPASSGDFYVSKTIVDGIAYYQYKVINLQAGQIPRSFGGYIGASTLFEDNGGKIGIGTNLPTEQLQLTGRGRMKALVLDENTESLPGQITRSGNRFSGTNASGVKRPLMYADYDETIALYSNFSTAQALSIAQVLNGGLGSGGNMSVNLISPPIIQNQYDSVEYILLRGANLNLSALSMGIQILAADKTTVVATIPNNQIQLNANGLELIFYYNFYNFPEDQYFIQLISGAKIYITSLDLKIVQSVTPLDLTTISWDFKYDNGVVASANDSALAGSFTIETQPGVSAIPKTSLKSSEIFPQGENFYIEILINLANRNWTGEFNRSYIGIGYSSTPNSTAISSQVNASYATDVDFNSMAIFNNNVIALGYTGYGSFTITIIKTGNLFRTVINGVNTSKTLSNDEGYAIFVQIVGRQLFQGVTEGQMIQGQIIKAFKLN